MRDPLKNFIDNNHNGFKEQPGEELWSKIDVRLKQENIKSKKISAMLKYGFGASILIAGTFVIMNLQKEKTQTARVYAGTANKINTEIPVSTPAHTNALASAPAKNPRAVKYLKISADSLAKEPTDTTLPTITPETDLPVYHGSYKPIEDSLDIANWPSAGSQVKKYSLSGDNSTGKTIGCITSVSKKINGFITLMQNSVPDKCLGKRIRLTGYIRTENVAEWAGLWLRVGAKGGNSALAFDNMRYGKKDRSITGTTERTKYEAVLDVPPNSANIIYGVMLVGTGRIYFDSFSIEIVDDSVPVTGGNPDDLHFTKTDKAKSYHPRNFWRYYVSGHTISKDGTWHVDLEPGTF